MTNPTEPENTEQDIADPAMADPEPLAEPDAEPDADATAEPGDTKENADDEAKVTVDWDGSPWGRWVSQRRKPIALIAGLMVVALVGTLLIVNALGPAPKDLVDDYLAAIHDGDVDAALEMVGNPNRNGRLVFLSAEAMAADWTYELVERTRSDEHADVDVTFRSGGQSAQGRFDVTDEDGDGWRIAQPFVKVELMAGGLDELELGSVRQPARQYTDQTGRVDFLAFPGVYDLYPSLKNRVTFDPGRLFVTPEEGSDSRLLLDAAARLTPAGTAEARKAVNAQVDKCAKTTALSPPGCPFSAEYARPARNFTDIQGVTWQVVTYPEMRFTADATGRFDTVLRKPGTVTLSATGIPDEPAGAARTTFTATCEFGADNLRVTMTMKGFGISTGRTGDYSASSDTQCY